MVAICIKYCYVLLINLYYIPDPPFLLHAILETALTHLRVWWTCFSTNSQHTYVYKMCSSSPRLVRLFVRGRLHTGASQEKQKEASPIRYMDDVLSLNVLEIKDTTDTDRSASYLDLHLDKE